ncbi:olfactory receptor 5T7-like [Ambystoma mexicanum]|uniref:olfactory receptor 5T7-like n=1 Tax=Ambystoma mexicanum TaxID=8296 RepID=UPI0037E843FB
MDPCRQRATFSPPTPSERRTAQESSSSPIATQIEEWRNGTAIAEFILLGFTDDPHMKLLLFLVFLAVYLTTLIGNVGMIILIRIVPCLQTPMYFFLSNLSFVDTCYVSCISPQLLVNFLVQIPSISIAGCAAQMYFSVAFGTAECVLLAAMAIDRYVAICNPLLYCIIMNVKHCAQLVVVSYLIGFLHPIIYVASVFQLPFCKSNRISHFFCDIPPLLKISCSDTRFIENLLFVFTGSIAMSGLIAIIVSYLYILSTILKISSTTGRKKTFSTCASHLTAVIVFYGTILFMYLRPSSSYAMDQDRVVSVFYTIVIPLLNPMIYSVRNREVKEALRVTMCRRGSSVPF